MAFCLVEPSLVSAFQGKRMCSVDSYVHVLAASLHPSLITHTGFEIDQLSY